MKRKLHPFLLPSIAVGIVILVLLAGWTLNLRQLFLVPIPIITITLFIWAIYKKSVGWLITTGNLSAVFIAVVIILFRSNSFEIKSALGILFGCVGFAWLVIFISSYFVFRKYVGWTNVLFGVFLSSGICLLTSRGNLLDFAFYTGIGLGLSLLMWGIGAKLFGLIIPGAIILTIAPGLNFSWRMVSEVNPISQTGVMLVWFGLGWALITISSRVIRDKFVWWPLIPAGVLEMVGIGLFLGGNPNITVGFLNNSTLMSLLLFGSYIFLLRLNFRK